MTEGADQRGEIPDEPFHTDSHSKDKEHHQDTKAPRNPTFYPNIPGPIVAHRMNPIDGEMR